MSGAAVLDVAFALLADKADWTDRLAAVSGWSEPPQARAALQERFAPPTEDDAEEPEETNVVELAAFIEFANRVMS